eukprot:8166137-Karenia_brevis.AAC.1
MIKDEGVLQGKDVDHNSILTKSVNQRGRKRAIVMATPSRLRGGQWRSTENAFGIAITINDKGQAADHLFGARQ